MQNGETDLGLGGNMRGTKSEWIIIKNDVKRV